MSKLIHKARRGTLWHGTSQVVLTVAGYLVAVILARGLGPADFGVYGLVYSFLAAVELVTMLGIPGAVSRLTAEGRDHDHALQGTGLTLITVLCSLAFLVLWLLAPYLAVWLGVPGGAGLIRIAVLDVPCFGIYFLVAHILNGRRDFASQSLGVSIYALSKVVGTAALRWVGLTIAGALIVNALSSVVGLLFVAWRAGPQRFAFRREAAQSILRLATPVALIFLGMQLLLNVDLWFLGGSGAGIGHKAGGYYVAAKNLARIPNLMAFVMNAVLVPSIAHAVATGDTELSRRIIRGSMRFLALTLIPVCALMATLAGPLLGLLFSAEYSGGARFLQLLVVANGLLHTLCSTFITILVATRHQRAGATIAVIVIVPAVVLSAVLVPWLGAIGAALAAVASALVATVIAGVVTRRYVGSFVELPVLLKVLLATLLVCAAASMLPFQGAPLVGELLVCGLLFLALCAGLGLVTRDDVVLFRGRTAR